MNWHMMNLEMQRQAWEQYAREKGIPEHEWPMQFKFFSEGMAKPRPPESFVDNQDPVSDTSGSDYSDDSRSPSISKARRGRGYKQQGASADLYDAIMSSEQASSAESDRDEQPSAQNKKIPSPQDEQESNLERLKRELARKKALLSAHQREGEDREAARPKPKGETRRGEKRASLDSDEAVPVKKITCYEKGKKIVKVVKKRRRNEEKMSQSRQQKHGKFTI